MITIAFQNEIRPALPVIFGVKDYRECRTTIEEMDRIQTITDIGNQMLVQHLTSSQGFFRKSLLLPMGYATHEN